MSELSLTYDTSQMDLNMICEVIQNAYWGRDLSQAKIERSFAHSSCVGLMINQQQVGFARAISDRETSAYIKDFFVVPSHQGNGYGRHLLEALIAHPELPRVQSWYLGTKDAHGFYEKQGFRRAPDGIYMFLHRESV